MDVTPVDSDAQPSRSVDLPMPRLAQPGRHRDGGPGVGGLQVAAPHPLRLVLNWGRRYSLWVFNFGLACCAIEFIAASMARHDFIRLGVIPFAHGPRQADLMVVSGTVTDKMAPAVHRLWEQMPEPKYVISFGACSNSGGPYWDSYSVTKGVDQVVPVDVYVPGCPPRPEALLQGIIKLQEKIGDEDLGRRYPRRRPVSGAAATRPLVPAGDVTGELSEDVAAPREDVNQVAGLAGSDSPAVRFPEPRRGVSAEPPPPAPEAAAAVVDAPPAAPRTEPEPRPEPPVESAAEPARPTLEPRVDEPAAREPRPRPPVERPRPVERVEAVAAEPVSEPDAVPPPTAQPVAAEPVAAEPVSEPDAVPPPTAQPEAAEVETAEPEAIELETTEAETTATETTETAGPGTAGPGTTEAESVDAGDGVQSEEATTEPEAEPTDPVRATQSEPHAPRARDVLPSSRRRRR